MLWTRGDRNAEDESPNAERRSHALRELGVSVAG